MRYCHRTSLPPPDVLDAAKAFFGSRMTPAEEALRRRAYASALGKVTITARAEGGHYTFIEVITDQVGESEIDRLAKRFLAEVHRKVEPAQEGRGGYWRATFAPYPASSTAVTNCSVVTASSLKSISASPARRSTIAEYTPAVFCSAFATLAWQCSQVIPLTRSFNVAISPSRRLIPLSPPAKFHAHYNLQ